MSSLDLHPEDLLDRVRRGQATASERERIAAHLSCCEACRFEQALLVQSMRDASPHPGDAARARAIEQRAGAVLAARGTLAATTARTRMRRAGAWIAAAVASSIATAAAAAVITQPGWLEELLPKSAVQQPPQHVKPKPRRVQAHEPVLPPVMVEQPTAEPDAVAKPEPVRSTRSAAELFAAANAARRERATQAAVRLYRELGRAHPRSSEASVARVALGRLLLDRAGDARGALREFDAYLADKQQQSLREDALIGRALALGRLERNRDELLAWNMLLKAFPASAYAEHARTRAEELR